MFVGDGLTGVESTSEKTGLSRRTVMTGAAWSLPAIAVAVAAPGAAASDPPVAPTDIAVTLQPAPPIPGQPLRLTYRGTSGLDFAPFPTGSTAIVSIGGTFASTVISGATISNQTGTDPITYSLLITNLAGFSVHGTVQVGASVSVSVFDGDNVEIGSDFTEIGLAP